MRQSLEMRALAKLSWTRLQHCRRPQLAEMLLHQSVMCLWKGSNGDVTRETKFLSNDYTRPNINPKTLTTLIPLTLTENHGAVESFCAPAFCGIIPAPPTVQ